MDQQEPNDNFTHFVKYTVAKILRDYPATRSNNDLLIKEYTRLTTGKIVFLPDLGINAARIQSILRSRRNLRSIYPELAGTPEVEQKRSELQEQFRHGDYDGLC
jgi:hypothetical protein